MLEIKVVAGFINYKVCVFKFKNFKYSHEYHNINSDIKVMMERKSALCWTSKMLDRISYYVQIHIYVSFMFIKIHSKFVVSLKGATLRHFESFFATCKTTFNVRQTTKY